MVDLYESMALADERRLNLARGMTRGPAGIAEAFARTREDIAPYANEEAFHDRKNLPSANPGELRATKDIALRLGRPGEFTVVSPSPDVNTEGGVLDVAYLDRELVATRTTKTARQPDVLLPEHELRLDLLLSARDGTPVIGEIKVGRDRDQFYALIQALACVALLASDSQYGRLRAHYSRHVANFASSSEPRFDIYIVYRAREGGDTFLKHLDGLAREIAPKLLEQEPIADVVRRVACVEASLAGERIDLRADWVYTARS